MALNGADIQSSNQPEPEAKPQSVATDGTEVKVTPVGRASYVRTVVDPGSASSSDVATTAKILQNAEKIKKMLRSRGG